jgi:CRP-like cAMP-binding protein
MNSRPESSPPVVPVPSPDVTPKDLPPLSRRPRESKSIDVPMLKPSLIPFDILKAHEAEQAAAQRAKEAQTATRRAPPLLQPQVGPREMFLERFFGSSGLLASIDFAGRQKLLHSFEDRTLKAGEVLVYEGEVANLAALVTSGNLALDDRSRAGQEANRFEVSFGHFVVCTAAMLGVPSRFKISAPGASTVWWLSHAKLAAVLREYPQLESLPRLLPTAARQLDRDLFWYSGAV